MNECNRFDMLISKGGDSISFVEISTRKRLLKEDAKKLYEHLFQEIPSADPSKYFLLVSQDHGYLWTPSANHSPVPDPTVHFPMNEVVNRYFKEHTPDLRLRHNELEIIIFQWLHDLTRCIQSANYESGPEKSLFEIGFLDRIQGAFITTEVGA